MTSFLPLQQPRRTLRQDLEEDAALVPLQLRQDTYLVNPKIENFNVYFVGYDFNLVYADLAE